MIRLIKIMTKGINPPQTKRGQNTFDQLIKAAISLFHVKGYHQTTIHDIVTEAGTSIGTFYIYFEDKYSLYHHVILLFGHEIRKAIALGVRDAKNREELERMGMKSFIKYVRENPHAYTVIWQSLQVDKNLFIDYYKDFAERYAKGLKDAFDHGEIYEIDFKTIAYAFMGISNFIGLQVLFFEDELKDDDKIDAIVDQVFDVFGQGLFRNK